MKIILLISFAFVVENAKFAVEIKKERPLCEKIILDSYIVKSYEKCGFSEILRSVLIRIRCKGYGREYSKN